MSYTRRFSRTITVHYSGSISYPASQNGGTTHYSGSTQETINFDVTVDTDPFDRSVNEVNNGVDMLTTAVAATEVAQVESIRHHSNEIGQTIVSGFFKTVKSDISQQISELKNRSEALLIQLSQLAKRCNDKKRQMGVDYQRISSRYAKIFTDLDNELDNRLHAIDQPVFSFRETADEIGSGSEKMVATPTVTAGENAHVLATMAASLAKRQASDTIGKMRRYLNVQRDTDSLLNHCLSSGGEGQLLVTPFAVADFVDGRNSSRAEVFASPMLDQVDRQTLASAKTGSDESPESAKRISDYFNRELADMFGANSSSHSRRVAEMAAKLFKS